MVHGCLLLGREPFRGCHKEVNKSTMTHIFKIDKTQIIDTLLPWTSVVSKLKHIRHKIKSQKVVDSVNVFFSDRMNHSPLIQTGEIIKTNVHSSIYYIEQLLLHSYRMNHTPCSFPHVHIKESLSRINRNTEMKGCFFGPDFQVVLLYNPYYRICQN